MAFSAEFKAANPDEIMFDLKLRMTLRDWKKLKDQLTCGSFPSWQLGNIISDMVMQASGHFDAEKDELDTNV